jgi:inhibitor of KinA
MSSPALPYRIFPLGDAAITVDLGNVIDEGINKEVITRFHELREHPIPGMTEVVPAYSSFTVYYDILSVRKISGDKAIAFECMKQQLETRLQQPAHYREMNERLVKIPVCYEDEFALDIRRVAGAKNISLEELIQIHTEKVYKVYLLGFLPGFAYMGETDEKIAVPRKPQPVSIAAGSVGIAGRQTGIYPLASPGGWQIIGRTPVKLFDADRSEPTLLQAGDNVQFYSINKKDFGEIFAKETFNR